MVTELSPLVDEQTAVNLYHRAASAWLHDQRLEVANGLGGYVDLTKLFEQYRMLQILQGNDHEKEIH
jgi:hypothetical protein